jgi:hypothetical protein
MTPLIKKQDPDVHETTSGAEPTPNPENEEAAARGPRLVGSEYSGDAKGSDASTTPMEAVPLFPSNELGEMRNRWDAIQTGFVDEPQKAVREADALVASAMQRLSEVFSNERSKLEQQWNKGDSVSTEDLRLALQRYRSFFHRVLSV